MLSANAEKAIASIPAGSPEAGGEQVEDAAGTSTLPAELLLEVMKILHGRSIGEQDLSPTNPWFATLLNFVKASRICHSLGMSLVLREVEVRSVESAEEKHKLASFLEDGLGINKFTAVRKLELRAGGGQEGFRLCGDLIRKVGPNLEELVFSLIEILPQPQHMWKDCECLQDLKKLTINDVGVRRSGAGEFSKANAGAQIYRGLLQISDQWKHLEDFNLDYVDARCYSRFSETIETWPEVLLGFPHLTEKLRDLLVFDKDVPVWATLPLPNLSEVLLLSDDVDHHNWKAFNPFPTNRKLSVYLAYTSELLDWPLGKLKEIRIDAAILDLHQSDYDRVRKRIEDREIRLVIEVYDDGIENHETLAQSYQEVKFWRTVKGVEMITQMEDLFWEFSYFGSDDEEEEDEDTNESDEED